MFDERAEVHGSGAPFDGREGNVVLTNRVEHQTITSTTLILSGCHHLLFVCLRSRVQAHLEAESDESSRKFIFDKHNLLLDFSALFSCLQKSTQLSTTSDFPSRVLVNALSVRDLRAADEEGFSQLTELRETARPQCFSWPDLPRATPTDSTDTTARQRFCTSHRGSPAPQRQQKEDVTARALSYPSAVHPIVVYTLNATPTPWTCRSARQKQTQDGPESALLDPVAAEGREKVVSRSRA